MKGSSGFGKWLGTIGPIVVLLALLGWLPETRYEGSSQSPDGMSAVKSAGYYGARRGVGGRSRHFHRKSSARSKKSQPRYVKASQAKSRPIQYRRQSKATKSATAKKSAAKKRKELTVSKSSVAYTKVRLGQKRPRWRYLTPSVRRQIDAANIRKGRWRYIVIHNSATSRGSAKAFDRYHREVRKMRHGLAYHFVVGNGSYSGDGEIEIGARWAKQLHGGHLKSMSQNRMAIGICLVGDFNSRRVRNRQLEALDELVTYLQAKCGKAVVTTHRRINVVPTSCPGRYFPDRKVMSAYNG